RSVKYGPRRGLVPAFGVALAERGSAGAQAAGVAQGRRASDRPAGAAGRACARPDPSSGLHQVRQAAGELRRPPGPRRGRAMVGRHARDSAGWHILEAMLPPLGTRAPRSSLIDGMLRRLDTGTPWRDPPGRVPGRPRAAA